MRSLLRTDLKADLGRRGKRPRSFHRALGVGGNERPTFENLSPWTCCVCSKLLTWQKYILLQLRASFVRFRACRTRPGATLVGPHDYNSLRERVLLHKPNQPPPMSSKSLLRVRRRCAFGCVEERMKRTGRCCLCDDSLSTRNGRSRSCVRHSPFSLQFCLRPVCNVVLQRVAAQAGCQPRLGGVQAAAGDDHQLRIADAIACSARAAAASC